MTQLTATVAECRGAIEELHATLCRIPDTVELTPLINGAITFDDTWYTSFLIYGDYAFADLDAEQLYWLMARAQAHRGAMLGYASR